MPTDDEFTRRLIGFGLSEKEAQTYLHLLKYGPKTPSPLAKSLHTYREDVHRTLTSLIDRHGVMFVVCDRKHSIIPIHIAASASLNTSMTALWTDNPVYAEYLVSTFEILWKRSVPAEERIQELLEQGPAQGKVSRIIRQQSQHKSFTTRVKRKRHASPVSHINIIN